MTERSTSGPISASAFQANVIQWQYAIRIDIATPVGTKRFTDNPTDLTLDVGDGAGSQTWTSLGPNVGDLRQGTQGTLQPTWIEFPNLDWTFSNWANSPGLRLARVRIWVPWYNPTTNALYGYYLSYDGRFDNQEILEWAHLAITPHHMPWSREAPFQTLTTIGAADILPPPNQANDFGDSLSRLP